MAKNGKRFKEIDALFKNFEMEPAHAVQVKKLALQLFDCLKPLHSLGEREREWLEAAALLHDIGWSQGGKKHHKKSMKLILQAPLHGWSSEEQLIIANIARYHRKSPPRGSHKKFMALPPDDRQKVRQLASLLRIADGLDRSHGDVVEKIDCKLDGDKVLLSLVCRRDLIAEHYGFEKKRDLFQNVFGLKMEIHDVRNSWDG